MGACVLTGSLPALHSLELSGLVKLHDAVDLSIGMRMILARILLLTFHPYCGDAEKAALRGR